MKNNFPSPNADDLVIAADAGYLNLQKAGIKPDVIIGDFDSAKKPETDAQVEAFPVLKDDTDTMLAIRYGFRSGYNRFEIYGGIGGERTQIVQNGLCDVSRNQALREIGFQRVPQGTECRKTGENRKHDRQYRHQTQDDGETDIACDVGKAVRFHFRITVVQEVFDASAVEAAENIL